MYMAAAGTDMTVDSRQMTAKVCGVQSQYSDNSGRQTDKGRRGRVKDEVEAYLKQ